MSTRIADAIRQAATSFYENTNRKLRAIVIDDDEFDLLVAEFGRGPAFCVEVGEVMVLPESWLST